MDEQDEPEGGGLVPAEGGEHVVINDGDGLAVIGDPGAVEQYLRREGLWEVSTSLDLRWLRPLLTFGAEAAHSVADAAASSGRWVKLTKESAEHAKEHGLMDAKTPGVRWLMAGKPGDISKWLATETGPLASAATNPQALSGLASLLSNAAGAMAQVERKQEVREITEFLAVIDGKLDDVRRTQRDAVLAKLDGVSFAINEAMSIREKTGHVSAPSWSKVQHLTGDIAEIESNALRALDALASKAGSAAKVRALALLAPEIAGEVDVWLSVLARCFQLHEEAAVLELDHVREVAPEDLDGHRLALKESREGLRVRITRTTVGLVRRLDQAASDADLNILLHSRSVRAVVESSNRVGASVDAFHQPIGIESAHSAVSSIGWRAALTKPDQLKAALGLVDDAEEQSPVVRRDLVPTYTSCRTRRAPWPGACGQLGPNWELWNVAHTFTPRRCAGVTVSMRKIPAGRGYDYLLKSVVRGDANMADPNPVTRYYTEAGTPPGRWMGSALHAFGSGEIKRGDMVTPQQLQLLIGAGLDPVTGEKLGRAFPTFPTLNKRMADRADELPSDLTDEQRKAALAQIKAEESKKQSGGVAGFDYTFSVPKSVSALWGLADAGTQALIVEAHHQAVAEVLDFMEREVVATRRGVVAGDGAVMQADIIGVAATAYDHWDSRLGDPQLHTHVVISSKVKTTEDGRWRSLDGRPMFEANVPISEHYNAVLADRMTRLFGIEWEQRDRGKKHNLAWELAPVPEELIREFSSRTSHIEQEADRLIAEYEAAHGHRPSRKEIIVMRAQATRATRPDKEIHSLFDLTTEWRRRARKILGRDAVDWAKEVTAPPIASPTLRADDVPLDVVGDVAVSVVGAVEEKRSTWKHWNLWAEASRQTMGWRFASAEDREVVVGMIVDAAKQESLTLTPPELVTTPEVFRRPDGTTRFRPRHSVVFTSEALLAAEDRLLARAEDLSAPEVDLAVIERVTRKEHLLSAEQSKTLAGIAVSRRQVDLLVGPAGAGKTTAMHALKTAWTRAHGKGSVVGLAPSAVAAQVLAEDLGIGCENTAKWLHEFDRGRAQFRKGQLVIIDEATLAGTLTLDRLTALGAEAGAKVLLVGDWAQLQSVDAGGAFSLLASARPDTPELTEVHRFTHEWEKAASLGLRHGRAEVISTYIAKDRVQEGTTDEMMDAAYLAWAADVKGGRTSILVAEAMEMVTRFNRRARADRIVANPVGDIEVNLADGTQASEGDLVITRNNDRRLHPLRGGWVRNGDRWTVTRVHKDGSMQVQRLGVDFGGTVTLPAAYVAEHVDLGYAVTAHRAQGMTVDTSHVVVTGSTTRENFYVAMTRGRDSNIAYVALDKPDEGHAPPEPDEVNAHTVLYGVLQHIGGELSAHEMIVAEQERWSSIAQLAAEYETIGAVAQRDRWVAAIRNSGLTDAQVEQVMTSQSLGPLTAELRRAESDRYDVAGLLPALVARRSLDDAEDIGAVLISRLQKAAQPTKSKRRPSPKLVVGLIPVADGPMSPEMAKVLAELADLMEGRAMTLAERAVEDKASWLKRLGTPTTATARRRWLREVRTVAAYRDRYKVEGRRPLGAPANEAQKLDAARAEQAIRRARAIAEDTANAQDGRSRALDARGRAIG